MENTTTYKPAKRSCYAVWEITLKCNLSCVHCGSRAGDARDNELTTAEALDLVHQLADVGVTEVTLIGGEAYLRKDWLEIAAEIVKCGMVCSMTTGGYGMTAVLAKRMKAAGISQVSVSIDGLEATHDRLRGKPDSWKYAFDAIRMLTQAGLVVGTNTQINRYSAPELPQLYALLVKAGAKAWQVQLSVPMGNAVENAELLLQPDEMLVVHPLLSYLAKRGHEEGICLQPGNNIGYYGPYERQLRSLSPVEKPWAFWGGCMAGLAVLGIESDGAIKACPSLPTSSYTGGHIREKSLYDIVATTDELGINLVAGTPDATRDLWGFCKTCDYTSLCRGGCNWTSHVFFDKRGNNPYCHHRALVHAAQHQREVLYLERGAHGLPFDNGTFGIQLETVEQIAAVDKMDPLRFSADKIQWPTAWLEADPTLAHFIPTEIERNVSAVATATSTIVFAA